ncbi:MAG: helix-turn-helix domain-containing protein [Clostridia bacterium]|nr:helix-turn-helix domain-containing protein [Clostridia bacterium]
MLSDAVQGTCGNDISFDLKLADRCANSFYTATGLGCTVADSHGAVYAEYGAGCTSCQVCRLLRRDLSECAVSGQYGMNSAARFGGKYIYFCPVGFACFVSPIIVLDRIDAKITVGPFLMVVPEDFVAYELRILLQATDAQCRSINDILLAMPYVPSEKVEALSTLLMMTVNFISSASKANQQQEALYKTRIEEQMSQYIHQIKHANYCPDYPFTIERELLKSIELADKNRSRELINKLLGHIMLFSGNDFEMTKARTYELLVLMTRAAINGGANTQQSLLLSNMYLKELPVFTSLEQLCYWLNAVIESFVESTFALRKSKYSDVVRKATVYMQCHCSEKLSLEQVARHVYLSPNYFSKVFKEELGENFSSHLNRLRIEQSKQLLLDRKLSLTQISSALGFVDQSYFTKIFRKYTGMPPRDYRKQRKSTEQ